MQILVMDKWKKKSSIRRSKLKLITVLCISLMLFFFIAYYSIPTSLSWRSAQGGEGQWEYRYPQCIVQHKTKKSSISPKSLDWLPKGEKYMWYAPHSGFSNQVSELRNAMLVAGILNRTLIVPPILDHHVVALGSCPKFRLQSALQLRRSVWDHVTLLMKHSRYVSIADIIDFSEIISSSLVKLIDFRVFASLWCGLDIESSCSGKLCHNLAGAVQPWGNSRTCGELLSGFVTKLPNCVYGVEDDCRTTVWTYQQEVDSTLDSFQPDDSLRKKKKIDFSRKRRNIDKALGPGTIADQAVVLLFGTLFTSPYKGSELYIDIHEAHKDERVGSLLKKIEFLPFAPEIVDSGKEYARKRIKEPFLCAQLRLLDGQFKNHWKTTFSALEDKIKDVQRQFQGMHKTLNIFLMTDLPATNWTGTYLGDLAADSTSFILHVLNEKDDFIVNTSRMLMTREYGFRSGFLPQFLNNLSMKKEHSSKVLPDILLYIEETICSCASVGFVGTAGSTIANNIEHMRKNNVCSIS